MNDSLEIPVILLSPKEDWPKVELNDTMTITDIKSFLKEVLQLLYEYFENLHTHHYPEVELDYHIF